MKRILTFLLTLSIILSLAACGGKTDNNTGKTEVNMTAQEILDTLKEKLDDSFDCGTNGTEDNISGYWGLDMSQIESWASMSNSNSAINPSTAVVLKVKDSYAQDAAALLQSGYEQMLSYSRMYNMDLQKVLQARLFVNGNYVALLILGAEGDWEASDEEQAKFAADEAAKADEVWSGIFGSADNSITIPADDGSSGFNMEDIDDVVTPDVPEDSRDVRNPENVPTQDDNTKKPDSTPDNSKNDSKEINSNNSGTKPNDTADKNTGKALTAQEVLDSLKKSLGRSYTSDTTENEARMSGYWGLDMSKIESWAAESNSMSSMKMDCAVILKVKDGYAQDAATLLQQTFEQVIGYARMYDMDLQRVLQARLFVNGNYIALLIEGQQPDGSAGVEDQAKFAADEAAKVDTAWTALFGSASNSIVIPAESESSNNGFDMSSDLEG